MNLNTGNFCIDSCCNLPCFNWKMRRTDVWVMLFYFSALSKSLISLFLFPSLIDASLKEVVERQFLCSGVYWPQSTLLKKHQEESCGEHHRLYTSVSNKNEQHHTETCPKCWWQRKSDRKVSYFWGFLVVVFVAGFVLFFPLVFSLFGVFFLFCSQESLVTSSLPLLRVYCSTLGITCSHVFYGIFDSTTIVLPS